MRRCVKCSSRPLCLSLTVGGREGGREGERAGEGLMNYVVWDGRLPALFSLAVAVPDPGGGLDSEEGSLSIGL